MVVAIMMLAVSVPMLMEIPIVWMVFRVNVIAVACGVVIGVPAVSVAVADYTSGSRLSDHS
jgi:hypothetical protein